MNNETKNCPFCGEEIKATAIKCKHCGEFLNGDSSKLKTNKNFLVIGLISAFIIIFAITGICFALFSKNECILTDGGYKSINVNYVHKDTGADIFNSITQEEKDLLNFFKKSESKENNTKLFEIYMDNLFALRDDFFNIFDYSKSLETDYGIKLSGELNDSSEAVRIIEPKINVFYFSYNGGVTMPLDESYILQTYCPYVNDEWREYFELSRDESKDFNYADYTDDAENKINLYAKWARRWDEFVNNYPNFKLNPTIKETIYDYANTVKNYY